MVQMMRVGTFHARPCVRAIRPSLYNSRPRWIPVLGPVHSDQGVVNFKPQHLHVDHRFLQKEQQWGSFRDGIDLVFSSVITTVAPVGAGGAQMKLENLPDNRHPPESYWRMMRRRLHSPYPPIHRAGKFHGLRNSTRPTGEKR